LVLCHLGPLCQKLIDLTWTSFVFPAGIQYSWWGRAWIWDTHIKGKVLSKGSDLIKGKVVSKGSDLIIGKDVSMEGGGGKNAHCSKLRGETWSTFPCKIKNIRR